jgi:monoamine oxidase
MSIDTLIVGGGISGLYLAALLVSKDPSRRIVLIEASDRLGGHIRSVYDDDARLLYEAGAGRFNKYHKKLVALLKKYKLGMKPIKGTHKAFRPVLCSNDIREPIDTSRLLETVLSYSARLTTAQLQQLTFGQLCNTVIGYAATKRLVAAFGYNAEFVIANAYTSVRIFREDFNGDTPYYTCVEGLSELVNRLEHDLLAKGVTILKNHTIAHFRKEGGRFVVTTTKGGRWFSAHDLVLAIPKAALMALDAFDPVQKGLLESVEGVNLHRIYAKYKVGGGRWLARDDVTRTTTDLPLRQFIPIDKANGVALVSYSDMYDADYWRIYAEQGTTQLESEIHKQLKRVYPQSKIPKTTEWIRSYFWPSAVHCWKAGVNATTVRARLRAIDPQLHIVGESYSRRQGWIEGALEMAEGALKRIS